MFPWLNSWFLCAPEVAKRKILEGRIPAKLNVKGDLNLARTGIRMLPAQLTADSLNVDDCTELISLPISLACDELYLRRTNVQSLPPQLKVSRRIDAEGCRRLRHIYNLRVPILNFRGCISLQALPDEIAVKILDVSQCSQLRHLPASIARHVTNLNLRGCSRISSLPEDMMHLETLDVSGCVSLETLPENIRVRSSIDVAGSSIKVLPGSMRSVRILWNGIQVPDHVAFQPETITVEEILEETNQTQRQLLLERMGLEAFLQSAKAEVIDEDTDPGGKRRLFRLSLPGGDDIVCVQVQCPSTASKYVLRVPPDMRTCRQAIAWTAGFSNPGDYQPLQET